jgi:hypothetical protein
VRHAEALATSTPSGAVMRNWRRVFMEELVDEV